jgi:hypothetical protein
MGPIFLMTFSVSSGVAGTEVMKQNPKSCYIDFQASEMASKDQLAFSTQLKTQRIVQDAEDCAGRNG